MYFYTTPRNVFHNDHCILSNSIIREIKTIIANYTILFNLSIFVKKKKLDNASCVPVSKYMIVFTNYPAKDLPFSCFFFQSGCFKQQKVLLLFRAFRVFNSKPMGPFMQAAESTIHAAHCCIPGTQLSL